MSIFKFNKTVLLITALACLSACFNPTEQQKTTTFNNQTSDSAKRDTITEVCLWADSFIADYLEANKDISTTTPVTYLKQRKQQNGRNYAFVRIVHSDSLRFTTKQIIYIDSITQIIYNYDVVNDTLIPWNTRAKNIIQSNEILPDGQYHFDIAYAEWEGRSMGDKVIVVIKGESIKVIYESGGRLGLAKKGDILDQGTIMKHRSGVWIIGHKNTDMQLDEIGGCTGGPAIIDFIKRKYWMC
ncbi:MAG: hypothetical protein V4613_05415 [Bacteroidota bacterium]